jgi:hypothetical protein
MAPFVLVGGLLADLYGFMVRVMQTVCDAFGWDDPANPEIAAEMVNFIFAIVGFAGIFNVIRFL